MSEPCDSYQICGCGTSDDGHCMYCLKGIIDHETVSREDIEEIHRRLQQIAADRMKWDARESALRALVAELREQAERQREEAEYGRAIVSDGCADQLARLLESEP